MHCIDNLCCPTWIEFRPVLSANFSIRNILGLIDYMFVLCIDKTKLPRIIFEDIHFKAFFLKKKSFVSFSYKISIFSFK